MLTNPDINLKLKICICVSGQIRTFMQRENMLDNFIDFLTHHGHKVTIIGHQWKQDQHLVTDKGIKFNNIIIEDQKDIIEYVKENIMLRKVITDDKTIKADHPDFIKYFTEKAPATYGQMWGAWNCLSSVRTDFDIVIRWRWDLGFDITNYDDALSRLFNVAIMNLSQTTYPVCLTSADGHLVVGRHLEDFTGVLCDTVMAFNIPALKKIKQINIRQALDNVLEQKAYYDRTPTSHTLWYSLLNTLELQYNLTLPCVFSLVRN